MGAGEMFEDGQEHGQLTAALVILKNANQRSVKIKLAIKLIKERQREIENG